MFQNLTRIINDSSFKIIFCFDKIDVINYDELLVLEDNLILIKSFNKIIKIKGKNLVMKKLESHELLVEGIINLVDLGD